MILADRGRTAQKKAGVLEGGGRLFNDARARKPEGRIDLRQIFHVQYRMRYYFGKCVYREALQMKKIRIYMAQVWHAGPFRCVSPPLGLLYIAAHLRERFPVEIRVAHQRLEKLSSEQLAQQIIDFEPDIVGLGCMTPSAMRLPHITRAIRAARPDTLIVLGGPHVAAVGGKALAPTDADLAVAGEGELIMEEVVRAWRDGSDMSHIPGLIRKTAGGDIVTNPGEAPIVEDLDTLPMPAYDLIDVRAYRRDNTSVPVRYRNCVALYSSRGCPYGCIYCHNIFGRRFRMQSPERMVEEARYYQTRFGVDEVEYYDDCFNFNRKRVLAFSEMLAGAATPIKLSFPNGLRADLVDEETVGALKHVGTYYIALAMESAAPRIQELIGKRLNIDKYMNAVEYCTRRRIFTKGLAMMGFPTETEEEVKETIRFAVESSLHICSFYLVIPFPNTPLYTYVVENMPDRLSNVSYDGMDYWNWGVNLAAVSDERMKYYHGLAYRKFYLRPGRIYRILRDYPKPLQMWREMSFFFSRAARGCQYRAPCAGSGESTPPALPNPPR